MTDKETIAIINDFETYINKTTYKKSNEQFNKDLSYGRAGEIAAMNILQYNYNNNTFIDAAKIHKPYDIVWYNKGNLIGVIDIKRQKALKNNNVIIELSNVNNYNKIGWWFEMLEIHTDYIGFITDDLKTLHLVKVNDIAKYINFSFCRHYFNNGEIVYVPLSKLQQLESYICLQGGEDND